MFTLREQSLLTSVVHFHLQKNTTHHLKIKENKRKPYSLKSTDVWTWSLQEHLWLFSVAVVSDPMDCSMPGYPVLRLPEFAETHVHWVSDAIQPSHPLSPTSPPALNLSQHQGLFQGVGSSHQLAKVLEHNVLKRGEKEAEYSCLISFLQVIFGQNWVFYMYYLQILIGPLPPKCWSQQPPQTSKPK